MESIKSTLQLEPWQQHQIEQIYLIESNAHSHPWAKKTILDSFSNAHRFGVVALNPYKAIVGFYIFSNVAGEMELLDIAVDPDFQGQGIGAMLIDHLIEQAEVRNAQSIFLEVRESNQSAIRLYEKSGFNQIGIRNNYYPTEQGRENALLYAFERLQFS